jgi:PQQ-like domain/IPT/TIG domain/S-layer homology domain
MRTMRNWTRMLWVAAPLVLLWLSAAPSFASELIFAQYADGQATYGPSSRPPGSPVNAAEVADDFNLSASVERIVATGYLSGPSDDFAGVYVRFYAYGDDGKPGALQSESFLAAGDPNLVEELYPGGWVDATLPTPFSATGLHFVSVQLVLTPAWYRWSSSTDAPHGQAFYFRDPGNGVPLWQHGDGLNLNSNADVDFQLYGTVTGAGHIDSLSASTLPRSGYLEIFGSNFGGSGEVQIDGLAAPVAHWSGSRVVAYVPEASGLASVSVQVTNSAGLPSNSLALNVTNRQPDGRVQWRFRMDGPYAQVRPVLGPDGTIYSIDVNGHLYALSPDGGLKWLARGAGAKGVAVGTDGSVYVGSEDAIRAFHSDGSVKWTFVQDPYAFILVGVSVGPDGNVYAVATEGMGVFSLTPEGDLRWQVPEPYDRLIVDYNEIVFGDNGGTPQLYFAANNHVRGVTLEGAPVFAIGAGGIAQLQRADSPAIGPDGSVHTAIRSFSPDGDLQWSFATPYPFNVFTKSTVGSDGVHYYVQNLSQLFALNPDGSQRWHVDLDDYVDGPIVDPTNTQLVMGGADTLDHPGLVLSTSAANGNELWRVVLPAEDGFNQFVDTRARFTSDGLTAYVVTATATGDNATSRSHVYSLDATPGDPGPQPDPLPVIFVLIPGSGPAAGGTPALIMGANYVTGAGVTIGGAAAPASVTDPATIQATIPALLPGTLNDLTVTNPDASSGSVPQLWFADFLDVPQADAFHSSVERIFRLAITAGCGNGLYCRDASVTRAQMAVFLLKAQYGFGYAPPPCQGVFGDVACPGLFADWIEQLAVEGITGGCGGGNFCPDAPVTRQQVAVFLLKSKHGASFIPASCIGVFGDVACPSLFADWIEQLAAEGITGGCGGGNYCPGGPSTRGQMAVFLTKTFQLP